MAQIGLDERPADRLRHRPEPSRGFGRTGRNGRSWLIWRFGAGQREEAPRLLGDIAKLDEPAALADDVEEIAIFSRGGISPVPGCARAELRPAEPDEHRPARRVADVAHRPVAPLATPVGEVMTAHRLGVAREAPRQLGSVARHHATLPNVLRLCCAGAVDRPRNNARSPGRNITLGATYSVLCAVQHKTDAATGEHGDLLDLIALNRDLLALADVIEEACFFLALPRPDEPLRHPSFDAAPTCSSEAARRLFRAGARSVALWPKPICAPEASPHRSIGPPSATTPPSITARPKMHRSKPGRRFSPRSPISTAGSPAFNGPGLIPGIRRKHHLPIRDGHSVTCSEMASASDAPPTSSLQAKASKPCSPSNLSYPCCR